MKANVPLVVAALLAALGFTAPAAQADLFGSGANSFEFVFVTIGSPGNPPDASPIPAGAVPYEYRIGKYEVSEQMIDKANALGALGITKDTRGPDKPATSVNWFEAARFVNWLNTSTGSVPTYKFDARGTYQLWQPLDPGYDANNLYRNQRAMYFLPSIDEWHKAAYYEPVAGHYWGYPAGNDAYPDGLDFVGDPIFDAVFDDGADNPGPNIVTAVGLPRPCSTGGPGGKIFKWEETEVDRIRIPERGAARGLNIRPRGTFEFGDVDERDPVGRDDFVQALAAGYCISSHLMIFTPLKALPYKRDISVGHRARL